jgi:hypothetical protein
VACVAEVAVRGHHTTESAPHKHSRFLILLPHRNATAAEV